MNRKEYKAVLIALFLALFTLLLSSASFADESGSLHITVVGDKRDATAIELYETSKLIAPANAVIRWLDVKRDRDEIRRSNYPLLHKTAAFVCTNDKCSLPIYNKDSLVKMLTAPTASSNQIDSKSGIKEVLKSNNVLMIMPIFWFVGLLLSLTPCLLPIMIIMTSIIGGHSDQPSKRKAFALSITYIFALSITYAVAGIVVSIFGLYLQGYMQNTWVITLFSLIFVLLGLSLFGLFSLEVPHTIRKSISNFSRTRQSGSYVGVAIIGILATLIASPCVAAPLAGILAYIAESGNVKLGAYALFATGVGIGTPVLVISMVGVEIMQKVGGAQKYVKQVFGIMLIAVAISMMSRVFEPKTTMILWASLLIFTAIYMGVLERHVNIDSSDKTLNKPLVKFLSSFSKMLSLILLIYGGAIFIGALLGNTDPLKPLQSLQSQAISKTTVELPFSQITTLSQLNQSLDNAIKTKKPVLVLFSAQWCTSCHEIRDKVLTDSAVQPLLNDFILLNVDLSSADAVANQITGKYNIIGPPLILIFNHSQQPALRLEGEVSAEDLSNSIRKIIIK